MSRVYNFSAGPSMLPKEVLQTASAQMLDYNASGQSVMEMSHRAKIFTDILEETQALLISLMDIPKNYKVLFLQGGASTQFSAIALNFANGSNKTDYIITGQWAQKAYKEAQKYTDAKIAASSIDKNFSYIPKTDETSFRSDADYVYICLNNTIYGTHFKNLPPVKEKPLIADISSCFLSEPIDVSKFAVLFGGAQKNLAPAGLTVVIVKEDILNHASDITPTMLNYTVHANHNSLYNTPPCFSIYICNLVLKWLQKLGGLEYIKELNEKKAATLYSFLDESKLFFATANKSDRSLMNIPFITKSDELNKKFIAEAEKEGFINLKGHRTVGGMRASIYNAMPLEGVEKLVEFMKKFESENT